MPRHDIAAELALLHRRLLFPESLGQLNGTLGTVDFYVDNHRQLFRTIKTILEIGEAVDPVTVASRLGREQTFYNPWHYPVLPGASLVFWITLSR